MAVIKFNGVAMPAPTKYDVNFSDIDGPGSGRNENAKMTRDIVRRNVANISISWENLNEEELEIIANEVDHDEIEVEFFWGKWKTAIMYSADLKTSMKSYPDKTYWSASCDLTEY